MDASPNRRNSNKKLPIVSIDKATDRETGPHTPRHQDRDGHIGEAQGRKEEKIETEIETKTKTETETQREEIISMDEC